MPSKTDLNKPSLNSLNWNVPLNANFATIDTAFSGQAGFTVTSSDVTATAEEIKNCRLFCTGTLTQNCRLVLPAGYSGFWIISNYTGGNFNLTVQYSSLGASVVLPKGGVTTLIYGDGNSIILGNDAQFTPPGTVSVFAGAANPPGWLPCDGSSYSTTGLFAALFAAIGYTWGGSSGTFRVPDLRGMFVRGSGTNGTYPTASGASVGGYQADTYLNHNHAATSTDSGHTHTYTYTIGAGSTAAGAGGTTPTSTTGTTNSGNANITTTINDSTTGGTETRPKSFSMLYIIKY